jgi:protein-tyrosine phosphatase
MATQTLAILFVCHGNICRSPTAEAVMRARLDAAGLSGRARVDSAGTHDYHVGEAPDPRACRAAASRGYDMSQLAARQVEAADFERFDHILAADRSNLAFLQRRCPVANRHKLALILDPLPPPGLEVPDPYYGGESGFDRVLDMIEAACDGWITRLFATR